MKRGQNRGMARKYLSLKQTQERLTVTKTLTQRELDFIHKIETVRGHPMTAEEIIKALDETELD